MCLAIHLDPEVDRGQTDVKMQVLEEVLQALSWYTGGEVLTNEDLVVQEV